MADDNNTQATQQPPKQYPVLNSLNKLGGTWKVSGPDIDGQVTFEWIEGSFFLIQHVDLEQDRQKNKGIEIIGHE